MDTDCADRKPIAADYRLVRLALDDRRRDNCCQASGHWCKDEVEFEASYNIPPVGAQPSSLARTRRNRILYCQGHGEAFAHRHEIGVPL